MGSRDGGPLVEPEGGREERPGISIVLLLFMSDFLFGDPLCSFLPRISTLPCISCRVGFFSTKTSIHPLKPVPMFSMF